MVKGNYAIWLKHLVYWEESNLGVIENSLMSLVGQKKMYQTKKTSPPIRDFMNERSLKLNKIFNLNLLNLSKSPVQAQSHIIKTRSIPISTRAEI